MPYAIRNDSQGWRSINSLADVMSNEHYSENQPNINFNLIVDEVSQYQGMLLLFRLDLLDQIKEWLNSNDTDPEALIGFESANNWKKTSPFVLAAKLHFNWTDEQLDQMFLQASQIQ